MPVLPDDIEQTVNAALQEDIGSGDLTASLIPEHSTSTAQVICRETAILCGKPWFNAVFEQLDANITIHWSCDDGDTMQADDLVCSLTGSTRSLLTGERSALNFLQTLSGTATTTVHYSKLIESYPTRILDTRKTIPGLRHAQKYAVACGGGKNHRMGLYDAILIKENHIIAAGSIDAAVSQAKQTGVAVEVEVESLSELQQAIDAGADTVLLDNFTLKDMQQAVEMAQHKVKLEASGGVDESSLVAIAGTGVDYVSIGALTKHLKATDFSMRFT